MKIPRSNEDSKEFFRSILPDDPRITIRPMFGNISAFVNGNMFAGLFGDDLFVRLADEESKAVRKLGGRDFEVMPGRAMSGYVVVPRTWLSKPEAALAWVEQSLAFTSTMPAKSA